MERIHLYKCIFHSSIANMENLSREVVKKPAATLWNRESITNIYTQHNADMLSNKGLKSSPIAANLQSDKRFKAEKKIIAILELLTSPGDNRST